MRHLSWFCAALLLAVALAWFGARTPSPAPADAPPEVFSAGRAMADVRAIGRAPHPTGSAENARVRAHVQTRMRELGLEVTVQRAAAVMSPRPGLALGGWVDNVVGVLPGRDRTLPPVLLMSHYDSAPGSPGAADDAAGVAASLEAVRALAAAGQPARDVVVLVTDGEEQGLLGAQAFFEAHPLADRIGAVVNLEARGSAGRAYMFETGPGNADAIRLYRDAVREPASNSLAVFLYRVMPNDTDFTYAREAGLPGYNIAFIGRLFHYHAFSSTPETLHPGSLQHLGGQTLDLLRALTGPDTLPAPGADAVYADLFGLGVLAYPAWGGWVALGAAALLIGGAILLSRRRDALSWRGLAAGAAGGLALLLLAAAAFRLARRATGVDFGFVEARPLMARGEAFEGALALIALGLALALATGMARGGAARWGAVAAGLGLAAAAQLFALPDFVGGGAGLAGAALAAFALARPLRLAETAAGLLSLVWAAGLAVQVAAPEAALALHWPLLAAAVSGFVALAFPGRAGTALVALAGGVGAGFVLLLAHVLYVGVGLDMPEVLSLCLLLAAAVLWPLLQRAATGWPGALAAALALAAGAGLIGWLASEPAATAQRPAVSHVQYLAEPAERRYLRISALATLDPWSRSVLASGGGEITETALPELFGGRAWTAPAPPVAAQAPALGLERLSDGRVVLRLLPGAAVRELRLVVRSDGALTDLTLNGTPLEAPPAGEALQVRWAAPARGLELRFRPSADEAAEVLWAGVHDSWPAGAPRLPDRPDTVMPWGSSDSLVAVGRRVIAPTVPAATPPGRSPPP